MARHVDVALFVTTGVAHEVRTGAGEFGRTKVMVDILIISGSCVAGQH